MKKSILFLLILIFFGECNYSLSQDTSIIKYLPLNIGNTWVYYYTTSNFMGYGSGYDKYKITGIQQINNKTYFVTQRTTTTITGTYPCDIWLFVNGYIRADSISGNIYGSTQCNSSNETLMDSLKSKLRDSSTICASLLQKRAVCNDTSMYNIFGNDLPSKTFDYYFFEGLRSERFIKNIGLEDFYFNWGMSTCTAILKGCVINGVLYGDTSMIVGINQISSETPNNFSLLQNYPNPFNPSTNIKFQIAKSSNAKLIIYDALGKEVETLMDKKLEPGEYEANFDGMNLPSGIYYYKLETGDFTETKKMALIK